MINSCVENVSQYILRPHDELHWVDFYGFKTSISGCRHIEFKITQTSVFLNLLKTVLDCKSSIKVHKNQCFTNDLLICGKCQIILRPQDELHWVDFYGFKTRTSGYWDFEFKITQTSAFSNLLKTVADGNWNLKVHKNQCFMNDQLLCGKCQPLNAEGTG